MTLAKCRSAMLAQMRSLSSIVQLPVTGQFCGPTSPVRFCSGASSRRRQIAGDHSG